MSSINIPPEKQFTKIFPTLFPHTCADTDLELLATVMLDPQARGPVNGAKVPAMLTYFGQFIDHDITHDTQSNLQTHADLSTIENKETSWFDLSNVYGSANEFLNAQGKFDIGKNSNGEDDLPRDGTGLALIADIRDDENLIISQLQLAFFKFHNKVFDDIQSQNPTLTLIETINEAKKIVVLHYQWMVVNEFLKPMCGRFFDRLFDINGNPSISPEIQQLGPAMPVEFSGALYRMGHSMVRDAYYINADFDIFPIFASKLPQPLVSPPDLRGKRPLPPFNTFDWSMFTPMPFSKGFQVAENFDYFVTSSLYKLPILPGVIGGGSNILPFRNLLRGKNSYQLPSGQDLARACGIPEQEILSVSNKNWVLQTLNTDLTTMADLIKLTDLFGEATPLFLYGLMDSHLNGFGEHLGALSSHVIGNVILNLILQSPINIFGEKFTPQSGQFGCVENGTYRFAEFFTYTLNLPQFTSTDILPGPESNYFDQFDNKIFSNALIGHKFQQLAIPGAIPEALVQPFPGMIIPKYGPSLPLLFTTQVEVNTVAQNAVNAGLDSYSCVCKFLINRHLEAIATGVAPPGRPLVAPKAVVLPGGILPVQPPSDVVLDPEQQIGKIIFDAFDIPAEISQPAALAILEQVLKEIQDALSVGGIPTPLY